MGIKQSVLVIFQKYLLYLHKYPHYIFQLDAFLAIPMEDLDGSANMQMFLRETLRCIFLDTCVDDAEKAVWIRIISAYLDTSNMARLLILLYGPVREGKSYSVIPNSSP